MAQSQIARFACLALLVACAQAQAASFDCSALLTAVEELVCKDAEVSELDDKVHSAFHAATVDGSRSSSNTNQRLWLDARDQCLNVPCLKELYRARLRELTDGPSGTKQARKPNYQRLVAETSLSGKWSPLSQTLGAVDIRITPTAVVDRKGQRLSHRFVRAENGAYIFRVDKKRSHGDWVPEDEPTYSVYVLTGTDSLSWCMYGHKDIATDLQYCRDAGIKYARAG